jgi:hypothetical protein
MRNVICSGTRTSLDDRSLDSDLVQIVRYCEDGIVAKRPSLQELHEWVGNAIRNRDAGWYRTNMPDPAANALEEDNAVRQYVIDLIVNASTEEGYTPLVQPAAPV